ncbi:sensor histidine kinase [Paenibacillus psychroresistens]|nr:histidine kinase [Paenibacillus psychroresistens]
MITILLPTLMIGGFEYIRHEVLLDYMTMETGNFYITALTFVLSYIFANWMFRRIEQSNKHLVEEQARRSVYEERERLANELHDNIAQTLFFLHVKLQKGHLEEAKAAVSDINNQVRQAIFNLRSSPDEVTDFVERIQLWLQEWQLITGITVTDEFKLEERYFSTMEEVHLLSIIQEAFTNIRKHSGASQVDISLQAEQNQWFLRIRDNGQGLGEERMTENKYGMLMMKRRSEEISAELNYQTIDKSGLEIIVKGTKEVQKV